MSKFLQTRNLPVAFLFAFSIKLMINPDQYTLIALFPIVLGTIFTEYTKFKDAKIVEKDQLAEFYEAKKEMEEKVSQLNDKLTRIQLGTTIKKHR